MQITVPLTMLRDSDKINKNKKIEKSFQKNVINGYGNVLYLSNNTMGGIGGGPVYLPNHLNICYAILVKGAILCQNEFLFYFLRFL